MLKVMTFNIKNTYQNEIRDGVFSARIEKIIKIIQKENPDILGLQEVTNEVKKIFDKIFVNYHIIGRSRYEKNIRRNEYNLLLIKKEIPVITYTTYSLGLNINKIRSKQLLSMFPRICTYAKINYQGTYINVYNTHLDHFFNKTKEKQLKILENIVSKDDEPVIIMGDFNMSRGNEIFKQFYKPYLNVATKIKIPTFGKYYLDHILLSGHFSLIKSYVHKHENYPSDHYPVIAEIDFK